MGRPWSGVRARDVAPELMLLSLILLGFLPLPPGEYPPIGTTNDIGWGAGYTWDVYTGTSVFEIRDPYLRYLPPAGVLWFVSLLEPVSRAEALQVYVGYAVVLAGLVVPTLLYAYARSVYDRFTGILVLGLLLLVHPDRLSLVPHLPAFVTAAVPNQTDWARAVSPIFGRPYLDSFQLQYVFPLPFIVGAFLAHRDDRSERAHLVSGFLLGVAGSIQVVQGLIAATVIGADHFRRRTWRALGITALMAVVVALPNVVVIHRFTSQWLYQGSDRISLQPENLLLLAGVVLAGITVIALLAWLWPDVRQPLTAVDPFDRVWVSVTLTLWVMSVPLAANWYRWLVAELLKYGVVITASVLVAKRVRSAIVRLQRQSRPFESL